MYDSRSDRPVYPGTHRAGHAVRHDCAEMGVGDYVDWGTPRSRRLALPAVTRREIADGLAEFFADREPA